MLIIHRSAILASMFELRKVFYISLYIASLGRRRRKFIPFVILMIYDFMRDVFVAFKAGYYSFPVFYQSN